MISVRDRGFFTTVQDTGRLGYRHLGVPVSGAMDRYAARLANSLLENQQDEALLEITMTGPELQFHEPTFIALAGADMSAKINDQPIELNEVHQILPNDVLSFGQLKKGLRVYLAVKGGFQTELVLNSRSFYKPITKMNRISVNMEIGYTPCEVYEPKIIQIKPDTFWKRNKIEVYPGPEFSLLEDKQLEGLFTRVFTVAKENNRMAYQLEEHLSPNDYSMLTSATLPGTVQLTPAGKLIILMMDGQTTGGYPRILQLSEGSINLLAQKKYGDKIEFVLHK